MNRTSVAQVLARANAAMVHRDLDVTGALAALLAGAVEALPTDAAAVLVESDGSLELLAATSHRVADLEVYQAQVREGPCLQAITQGEALTESGEDALRRRWPVTGPVIVESGYAAVGAIPLTWQGRAFGGLNLFRTDATPFDPQAADCQALADAVTLILVSGRLEPDDLAAGLRAALEDRAVVEQAKGALAYVRSVDVASAYDVLVDLAEGDGITLGVAARRVMEQARTGTLGSRTPRA